MKKFFMFFTVLGTLLSANVILDTNYGKIELKLFPKAAPLAVENFTKLVQKGYYNGVTFHRVIKNFVIQGGDPTGTGRGGSSIWGKEFKDEYAPNLIFDKPYILAMANHGANTNSSQFFITLRPTPQLNGSYTIFGKVVKGQKVVDTISNVQTTINDRPVKKVIIKKAYLTK